MNKKAPKITFNRKIFNKKFKDYSDSDILKELLYSTLMNRTKLEKIRANTNTLIWFLIVVPIILVIIAYFIGRGF